MLCDGPKKSHRTSFIVQIIFDFRSFEISGNILKIEKNSFMARTIYDSTSLSTSKHSLIAKKKSIIKCKQQSSLTIYFHGMEGQLWSVYYCMTAFCFLAPLYNLAFIASLLRVTDEDSLSEIVQYDTCSSVFIAFKGTNFIFLLKFILQS